MGGFYVFHRKICIITFHLLLAKKLFIDENKIFNYVLRGLNYPSNIENILGNSTL